VTVHVQCEAWWGCRAANDRGVEVDARAQRASGLWLGCRERLDHADHTVQRWIDPPVAVAVSRSTGAV
jgi:hypothetical protein